MKFAYVKNDKLQGIVKEDAKAFVEGRADIRPYWVDYALIREMLNQHLVHSDFGSVGDGDDTVGWNPFSESEVRGFISDYRVLSNDQSINQNYGVYTEDPFRSMVGQVDDEHHSIGSGPFVPDKGKKVVFPALSFTQRDIYGGVKKDHILELQTNLCKGKFAVYTASFHKEDPIQCKKSQYDSDPNVEPWIPLDTYGYYFNWNSITYKDTEGKEAEQSSGESSELTSCQSIDNSGGWADDQKSIGIKSMTAYFTIYCYERKDVYVRVDDEEDERYPGYWNYDVINTQKTVLCGTPVAYNKSKNRFEMTFDDWKGQLATAMSKVGMQARTVPSEQNCSWHAYAGNDYSWVCYIVAEYDQDHIFQK